MVLELAVTAGCKYILTYNVHDFRGSEKFGIEAITPKVFLEMVGELNQLITLALAEKLAALGAEDYLEARAKRGSKTKFRKALSKVAKVEPPDYDRL